MLTIRGVYDGRGFRPLPSESLPHVHRKVPVAIVFLEDISGEEETAQSQLNIAGRMRAARNAMLPLGMSVKNLVEEGRER